MGLIINEKTVLTPEDYGAVGDGVTNDYAALLAAFNDAILLNKTLVLQAGRTYYSASTITPTFTTATNKLRVEAAGAGVATINIGATTGSGVRLYRNTSPDVTTSLAANARIGDTGIEVADADGIAVGDLVQLQSTKAWYHDAREAPIVSPSSDTSGTAQGGSASTLQLKSGTTHSDFTGLAVTITAGTGVGQSRTVASYDDGTKTCTMATNWTTAPDATSTYCFPQLRKGELHKVIAIDGDVLTLQLPLMDGYDVVNDTYGDYLEDVAVAVYSSPLQIDWKNVAVEKPQADGYDSECITAWHLDASHFENVGTKSGTDAGLWLTRCYDTRVINPTCDLSNRQELGYGIQSAECTKTYVLGGDFSRCRRGIDVSGSFPDSLFYSKNAFFAGGGSSDAGNAWGPNGAQENSGFGTHGGCRLATYESPRIGNSHLGMIIRGRDIRVVNPEFFGAIDFGFNLQHGCNFTCDNPRYIDIFNEGTVAAANRQIEDNSFEATALEGILTMTALCEIEKNWEAGRTEFNVNGDFLVTDQLIRFNTDTASTVFEGLTLNVNGVRFLPPSTATNCSVIDCTGGGNIRLSGARIRVGSMAGPTAQTTIKLLGANIFPNQDAALDWNFINGIHTKLIANDTVARIRVGQSGNLLYCRIWSQASVTNRFSGLVGKATTSLTADGFNNAVAALATVPTGTTGATSGVNLHYSSDGEWLYIENRSGANRDIHCQILWME